MTNFVDVPLQHDGADLIGVLALPSGTGPQPGVLVVHTALGLTEAMRERAARLAELGYVALAVDLYGGAASYASAPDAAGDPFVELLRKPGRLRARMAAWLDVLKAHSAVDAARTAATGYCFGGRCVLELARSGAELRAVVSYHGLLTTEEPAAPGVVRAHVAVYAGGRDPYAPQPDIAALESEMIAAGASYSLTVFGDAGHGFTDPDAAALGREGIAYDAVADAVSWSGTVALLATLLA